MEIMRTFPGTGLAAKGRYIGIAGSALVVALLPGVASASGVKLAPHRAVYEMSLARAASASGVVALTGRMVYELTGDVCKGYKQNMRFVTRSTDNKGAESIMDLRSKFWEDGKGRSFRFDTDQYRDDKLQERAAGNAERSGADKGVSVRVVRPVRKKFDVGGNVLFPIQHSVEILQAAKDGRFVFTSDLYDGSEKGTKVYATTAIVGEKKSADYNAKLDRVENSDVLDGLAAWPVSLSYFAKAKGKSDAIPSYELGFLFFENGVSRELLIDYGHFVLRGKMTKLEMLKAAPCNQ